MHDRERELIEAERIVLRQYSQGLISLEEAKERIWQLVWCTAGLFLHTS